MNKLRFIITAVALLAYPAFASNVLTNGHFEDQPDDNTYTDSGWSTFGSNPGGREPWAARSGERGGYFPGWLGPSNGGIYQDYATTGGVYTFSIWVRREAGFSPSTLELKIEWRDISMNDLGLTTTEDYASILPADEGWHQILVTSTGIHPDIEFARVVLTSTFFAPIGGLNQGFMFDDAVLCEGQFVGTDVLGNKSFDDGDGKGWRGSSWYATPEFQAGPDQAGGREVWAAHSGTTGVALYGFATSSNNWNISIYQNLTPSTGTYTFAVWLRRQQDFNFSNATLSIQWYSNDYVTTVSPDTVTNLNVQNDNAWHLYYVTGTCTNEDLFEARVCLDVAWGKNEDPTAYRSFLIDDACFYPGAFTGFCKLVNGNFEAGYESSWRGSSWSVLPGDENADANARKDWADNFSPADSSTYGGALAGFPDEGAPTGSHTTVICQSLYPVVSTGSYAFAIHAKREGNFVLHTGEVRIVGYDWTLTNEIWGITNNATAPADGVWREYYVSGENTNENVHELRCYFYAEYDVTTNQVAGRAMMLDNARFFKTSYDGIPFFTTNIVYFNDDVNGFPITAEKVPGFYGVFLEVNYNTGTNITYVITERDAMSENEGEGGLVGLRYFWSTNATTVDARTTMTWVAESVIDAGDPFHGQPAGGQTTVDVWCVKWDHPMTNGAPVTNITVFYAPYIQVTNEEGVVLTWWMANRNGHLTNAVGQQFFADFSDRDWTYYHTPLNLPSELQDRDFNDPNGSNTFDNIAWTGFGNVERPTWAAWEGSNGVAMQTWASADGGLFQDLANTGGVYTFTAWMKKKEPAVDMTTAEFKLEWYSSFSHQIQAHTQNIVTVPSDGRWHRICMTVTTDCPNIAFVRPVIYAAWNDQTFPDYSATMIDYTELYRGQFTSRQFFANGRFSDPFTTNSFLLAKWDGVPSSFNDSNNSVGVESWADRHTPGDLSTFGGAFKAWRTNGFLATLSQAMNMPTGTYVFSAWLRREGAASTTNAEMRIEWWDKTLTNKVCADSVTNLLTSLPNDSQWYFFCVTGTCGSLDLFEIRPVVEMGWMLGSDNAITMDDAHMQQTTHNLADGDYDGLPDDWETNYFGSTAHAWPEDDVDTNGHSNLEEYIADTVPTNPASTFELVLFEDTNSVVVTFPSSLARDYTLQVNSNLLTEGWHDVDGQVDQPGTNVMTTLIDTNDTGEALNYRVGVGIPP